LFVRALVAGWGIPEAEKKKIITAMLVIVLAPRTRRHKNQQRKRGRLDPHPTERERIQAARVLSHAHAADTAIFLECLRELHVRERSGMESDPWETPTPTGSPVGPSTTKDEADAEFSIPTTVETPAGTLTKELTDDDLDDYVKRRFARHFGGDNLPPNCRA
jgi:hypothetical protein